MLHGDRGSLHAHAAGCRLFTDEEDGTHIDIPPARHSEHALELEAFADAVAGAEGPTTGVVERRSLAVVEAGYESMARGEPIDLEQRFGAL